MKIYLSGPMTGIVGFNYPAFHAAADFWRGRGHVVLNPAETDGGDTSKEWGYYLRKDIAMVLEAEAVAVLPGWQRSRGARLEVSIAQALRLPVLCAESGELVSWDEEEQSG